MKSKVRVTSSLECSLKRGDGKIWNNLHAVIGLLKDSLKIKFRFEKKI